MINALRKTLIGQLAVSLVIGLSMSASAQVSKPMKPLEPSTEWLAPKLALPNLGGDQERSLTVDKNVNASFCVTEGKVSVNGWNRNEVRVLVRGGTKFGFQVQYSDQGTKLPNLIRIVNADAKKYSNECIWGESIQIDAPVNSSINIKGQDVKVSIDNVRKSTVRVVGGDVQFHNIPEGISASTGQGDLSVENSTGPMTLDTTTGNIIVFDSRPREIGDMFKAKTNSGNVSLEQLGFRQVEVNSISGSVLFNGEVIGGGNYAIVTTKGSIRLQLPTSTSCQFSAIFSEGNFVPEIPYKVITEDIKEGSVKNIVGKFGSGGDTWLKLSTSLGIISVKKQ